MSLMEKLLAESNFGALKAHSVINATVTEIREDKFVVVDINGKSEGFIPQTEFPDMAEIQVGMQLEVYLEKLENKDGTPTVSFDRAQQIRKWESIEANCQEGSVVQGRVKSIVKGGLIVSVGVDAFMPSSQIDVNPPKNLEQFVGQTFDFKIIKINKEKKNLMDMYIRNVKIIEDAFDQIKEATGISSVEEIVTTFIKAEEQNYSLYNYEIGRAHV